MLLIIYITSVIWITTTIIIYYNLLLLLIIKKIILLTLVNSIAHLNICIILSFVFICYFSFMTCQQVNAHRHTFVHTYIHTYVHTYICTYIHTYMFTHIWLLLNLQILLKKNRYRYSRDSYYCMTDRLNHHERLPSFSYELKTSQNNH